MSHFKVVERGSLCLSLTTTSKLTSVSSAALDSQSEKVVVEALESAMSKTRCMLMVTHRLGVIRSLGINKVVVLDRGKIVEVGDPEELLRKADGLYSQLALEQGILPSSTNVSLSPA